MGYPFGLTAYFTSGGSGGGSGVTTMAAVGSSPSANGASISGVTLTLQPADGTHPGVLTTAAQTIAGVKTFSSAPVMSGASISSGTIVNASIAASTINLTAKVTGILPVANGGTGSASQNFVDLTTTQATIAGDKTFTGILAAGSGPTTLTNASGTLKSASLDVTLSGSNTGDVTLGAVGSSPSANGASLSSQVLTLQPADATHPGVVTTGTQTIAGAKTLSGQLTLSSGALFNGALGMNGGNVISINATGAFLSFANSSAGSFFVLSGNTRSTIMTVNTNATANSISFNTNFGLPFFTTQTPAGTTQTIDWTNASTQKIDAASTTGTLVLTFSNPVDGGRYILKTLGKTGRAWTFPTSVKWAGGVAPTVTAVDGAKDMFEFVYDSGDSTYVGYILAQNVS